MKIAIHDGKTAWSDGWITYCENNNVPFIRVNCYDSEIIEQLSDCSALMWHFSHWSPTDMLMARHVTNAAEQMGLQVFPNFKTAWHFDDKVAQKYLFESTETPCAKAWVFYNKTDALAWSRDAHYPVVAKLRRGAGSYNVKLIKTPKDAAKYIRRMFGRGYPPTPGYLADIQNKVKRSGGFTGAMRRAKKIPRFFRSVALGRRFFGNEKGYVYFQEFLPDNSHDVRISVVGKRAWGYRRVVREGDFRASGSGMLDHSIEKIPLEAVQSAFEFCKRVRTQSTCFDFVQAPDSTWRVVEVSYGFVDTYVYNCPGYWDPELNWHEGNYWPQEMIIKDLISSTNYNG